MKETNNPVVWQSRTWLMDAFTALMAEKKFEEITTGGFVKADIL